MNYKNKNLEELGKKIDDICGKFRPLKKCLSFKKRLYYANVNHIENKYIYKKNRFYLPQVIF